MPTSNITSAPLVFEPGRISPVLISNSPVQDPVNNDPSAQQDYVPASDPEFTIAEKSKYARRYEEGYDLPDAQYEKWLEMSHPEVVNRSPCSDSQQPFASLISTPQAPTSTRNTSVESVSSSTEKVVVQRSPLSDLLNVPTANKPKVKVTTGKARVLTSAECLKALQDKENEKCRKSEEK